MNKERLLKATPGPVMLLADIALGLASAGLIYLAVVNGTADAPQWGYFTLGVLAILGVTFISAGFFTLQPNEARLLVLFGQYRGTVRDNGFLWALPFYTNARNRMKVSLRARTLLGDKLKVNDRRGNPVEIATVVVWRVDDTAQAMFDVDDYESYVSTQTETALRHVATAYAYDHGDEPSDDEITLRGNPDEVSAALREDLGKRLSVAGVVVDDARLTHLAYASEIAQAMLRRQQAEAVIAARKKIVTGAVSMVQMALAELSAANVVELDDERKAAMVSNLMVVLCSESDVSPVINAGTLYA